MFSLHSANVQMVDSLKYDSKELSRPRSKIIRLKGPGLYSNIFPTLHSCFIVSLISRFFAVPPVIIDNMTSTDMVVREGTNVTMVCRATGYPEPYVMWRREDGQEFNCNGESGEYAFLYLVYCRLEESWFLIIHHLRGFDLLVKKSLFSIFTV